MIAPHLVLLHRRTSAELNVLIRLGDLISRNLFVLCSLYWVKTNI